MSLLGCVEQHVVTMVCRDICHAVVPMATGANLNCMHLIQWVMPPHQGWQ